MSLVSPTPDIANHRGLNAIICTLATKASGIARHTSWRSHVKQFISLGFLLLAGWFLYREFRNVGFNEILQALNSIPLRAVVAALFLTVISYAVLSCFDFLAVRQFKLKLNHRLTFLTAFIAYAFNFNLGSIVGAVGLRYKLYSKWGVRVGDITRITVYAAVTSWVGYCIFAGVTLSLTAFPLPKSVEAPIATLQPLGFFALGVGLTYFALSYYRRKPLKIRKWRYELPETEDACLQVGVSCLQWFLISGVLFLVFPAEVNLSFYQVLTVHLVAAIAGVILHVPGGVGVLEGTFVLMLGSQVPKDMLLGGLIAFRAIYYVVPLAIASAALLLLEADLIGSSRRLKSSQKETPA